MPSFVDLVLRDNNPSVFHLISLPFSHDLRNVAQVLTMELKREPIDTAKAIIKKLRMREYDPADFENPDLQRYY